MIDRVLIDNFNIRSRDFAIKWKDRLRRSPQLKHYNLMDDETIIETGQPIFRLLSGSLDRGFDHARIESFFEDVGKHRLQKGFPISEVIYGLNTAQRVVIEHIMTDFAPENAMRMYQSLGALTTVSEFFLLGSLHIVKGFLNETYAKMNKHEKESLEPFRKYFKDDFFFSHN